MVTERNNLDGRPDCAPSHWNENFEIYYLTEKMRSRADPYFSDLCDRVARGKITEEDIGYLNSRILNTDSENDNECYKKGKLSVIVTTNKKKDLYNSQKLQTLLPDREEFVCDSKDRVTNVPGKSIPGRMKDNAGKTGNLQTVLKLKVGAPVLITSNHPNKKYKEDGLINGARGYVQCIQVSKENPAKVEVVWVVFNKENIGRLYRFEKKHLRHNFNPGHERATPILPERKNFKEKYGNIEYQRTNFPLALAYAMTAHKCQGETLDEVIIDFGANPELQIKNYVLAGSFYVALTRVKEGRKVFLKSFEKSYVLVNKAIEEKVNDMKLLREYKFKKVFLDEEIFEHSNNELKVGYLNINGLMEGDHADYLNRDYNLKSLDILVLAETKLSEKYSNEKLKHALSEWNVCNRYDSQDGKDHMGLIILSSKDSPILSKLRNVTYQTLQREESLQIQGLIFRVLNSISFGFVYCRSSPTNAEIKAIQKHFDECQILMGDFNLSHRVKEDQQKVQALCKESKINALKEITRSVSNNQLDYILIDKTTSDNCFTTSYHNFISDHNAIIVRVGLNGNVFSDDFKKRKTFDRESHLKRKASEDLYSSSSSLNSSKEDETSDSVQSISSEVEEQGVHSFKRRFKNADWTYCWLNSCLQLVLSAFDHSKSVDALTSELGLELMRLQKNHTRQSLDASNVRNIIVTAEDTRIATRLSQLKDEVTDSKQLKARTAKVENMRLNLISGQQCVRDFFLCLNENCLNWPDVYSYFGFNITHSTKCDGCGNTNSHETLQSYLELEVPPENSDLSDYVGYYFNTSELIGVHCKHGCKKVVQVEKRSRLTDASTTEFITTVLTRTKETSEGYKLNLNSISSSTNFFLR